MPRVRQRPAKGPLTDAEANDLLMELLAIPGVSGEEHLVAEYIEKKLLQAGAPAEKIKFDTAHKRSVFDGLTGNLIVRLPGTVRGPRRLLVAHMDTVPICRGARPVLKGKRIVAKDADTGLGGDDRAGVAVVLSAALSVLRAGLPHPPLTFLWTVQEEVGMYGARHVRPGPLGNPKLAFSWDGGEAHGVRIGAIGADRMAIDIRGIASHAGINPQGGVNAIAVASAAIADLVTGGWHGQVQKGRNTGTCNVGVIDGGESTNVVPDNVHVRLEARSHSAPFRERIVREVRKAFESASERHRNDAGERAEITFNDRVDYDSFRLPKSDPSVKEAATAVKEEGREPVFLVGNGGLDANWLTANGIPTVTLGCGQREVHTSNEWVDLGDYQLARRVALRLVTG